MLSKNLIISLSSLALYKGNVLSLGHGSIDLDTEPRAQPPSSFFQVSRQSNKKASNKMSKFMKEISEDKEVQKAEAEWEASKKHTDDMLAKVHQQMAKLNKDLALTEKQEKIDLINLQNSREKEDRQLEETEKKLEKMAKETMKLPELKQKSLASFIEESQKDPQFEAIFAPLKNAAASAKKFADEMAQRAKQFEKMKKMSPSSLVEAMKKMDTSFLPKPIGPESFIQSEGKKSSDVEEEFTPDLSGSAEQRDHSLSLAQQALSRLNQDLVIQRKHLHEEEARLREEEEKDGVIRPAAAAASFLQTDMFDLTKLPGFGGPKDPLSPESLQAWSQKFEAKLKEARDIASEGLPEDTKTSASSFLETSDAGQWPPASYVEAQESIRRGQKEIERMDEQFKEGMVKLKQQNAQMMEEAKHDLEKDREIKEELEAQKLKTQSGMSLLEVKEDAPLFDAKKEEEHIRDLERGWKRDAAEIAASGNVRLAQLDQEQHTLMEGIKEKEDAQNTQMDLLEQKLSKDLEKLHKDVLNAQEKAHPDSTTSPQV